MARFRSLIPGAEIENAAEDCKSAVKIEQYRIGASAVYLPYGFNWNYIPRSEITGAEASHRSVTGGHCVTVTEVKPAVDLITEAGPITLELDRKGSMQKVLDALGQ